MLSTDLKQGGSYAFEIIKDQSVGKYFKVKTEDNLEFTIHKFRFQYNQPLPDYLQCYVKSLYPIILGQDIAAHIANFYTEGQEYGFIVKDVLNDSSSQYELEDEHGLRFKLSNSPVPLAKGTRVRCRVIKIKDAYVNLKYVVSLGTKFSLEFHTIEQWIRLLGIKKIHANYYKKLLELVPQLQPALIKYQNRVPGWTLDLLQICTSNITEWLVACKDDLRSLRNICDRLELGRQLALYMLEESDFLRSCSLEHRYLLQGRLSNYVELFEQYKLAASKILDRSHEEYIDKMFSRLKNAGYLYKPSRQIRIMMTILKLRPELINSRMGELFEALHNWDISNWMSEPFRAALVQQLQIFIEENAGKINLLPASDSSYDNKVISRMIIAIAIQRLLATEADNIDYNLNRAMLYRYISFLSPSEVNNLLDKAIVALLGLEVANEFSWSDTENPTLLFIKSSHPLPADEERTSVTKSYITDKAELHLSTTGIHIIGAGADPETTVIPNNMFDWMNPMVSLMDPISFSNAKKGKDLNSLKETWDNIAWSLFGGDESAGQHIEKRFPDEGEEVTVVIDDVRVIDYGHEKQRLQFHCTIHDDSYYGEGWMPCDSYHMIGWLTYKDIPGNYDKSLSFALDENGDPLQYVANVHLKSDGSLEFSMKTQIEDYLLENSFPGMESIAIVTYFDRINNAWLCLSETGATYKVACDDTTADLSEGKLVRVRYLEPDRSLSTPQFFIGELAPDQSDIPFIIKKSECLKNLMSGLGQPVENDLPSYQVMDSGQVLSHQELIELIYILQRRAFSETEYIKAYNFLGLASLLCRLAEDFALLKDISAHMKLLEFLQDFSRNRRLDYKLVDDFEDKVKDSPMLERLYTRIRIVSDIDSNQNSPWLWEIRQNPRNETEGKLASLVLSYNMLPKELEDSRKQILNEVSSLLNINNAISTAKYYGDESQTIEFKSSMVYTSKSGNRPDPKTQLHEITHIICGFMNARGGKLYIGVNDSGYENGLNDDITYRKNRGEKASIDGMIVELQNHLDRTMPSHAKDHWEISSDPEAKKGVIVVDVKPVRTPVELDGIIYVRASSTTKPRLGEEREEFIKSREHNYKILMALWGISDNLRENDRENHPGNNHENSENNISHENQDSLNEDKELDPGILKIISTGTHRPNVLHDYEESFVTPSFYIYFNPDYSFFTSLEDLYIDHRHNPEECKLALAVLDKERNGNLLITYEKEGMTRISMKEIADMNPNQDSWVKKGWTIRGVNVANDNDYLLSVLKIPSGALFYRLDKCANIPLSTESQIQANKVCSLPHTLITQEIIHKDKLNFFEKDSIDREPGFYGSPIPIGDGTLTKKERISELLRPALSED